MGVRELGVKSYHLFKLVARAVFISSVLLGEYSWSEYCFTVKAYSIDESGGRKG